MTDRELHKLRRAELLEMLLQQSKTVAKLRGDLKERGERLVECEEELRQLQETYERLRKRLDEKDAVIRDLRGKQEEVYNMLGEKDELLRTLSASAAQRTAPDGAGLDERLERLDRVIALTEKAARLHVEALQQLSGGENAGR